jgi:hypothetical protein
VLAHIWEIPILCSNQVRPVTCRYIGLALGLSVIAYACHDGRCIPILGRQQMNIRQGEQEREKNRTTYAFHRGTFERGAIADGEDR